MNGKHKVWPYMSSVRWVYVNLKNGPSLTFFFVTARIEAGNTMLDLFISYTLDMFIFAIEIRERAVIKMFYVAIIDKNIYFMIEKLWVYTL